MSFYQAAGQEYLATGATTDQWEVTFESDTQYSTLMTLASAGQSPWNLQTMSFTASSTSELLSFIAVGTGEFRRRSFSMA